MKRVLLYLLFLNFSVTLPAQLIITELADPNDEATCRFVEIYNPTSSTIDLAADGFALQRWTNASSTPQSAVDLTGTIAAGATYVICNNATGFGNCYPAATCDQNIGTGGAADSNGDDNIAIVDCNGNIVDLFGVPGTDGSNQWHEFEDGRAERVSSQCNSQNPANSVDWNVCNDNSGSCGPIDATPPDATFPFDPGVWIGSSTCTGQTYTPLCTTCDLIVTVGTAACDDNTAGVDTYTATFTYTDTDATGTYTVSSSTGTPDITTVTDSASGTITVTGVSEGTDVTITFTDGADCIDITATVTSPVCDPPPAGLTCTGTTIAEQDFESAASDTWTISAGSANISADTGTADFPPNERICSGTNSWQVTNETATLELADIDITDYEDVTISFKVTSTGGTSGNGNDGSDEISVFVNINGVGYPATADLELEGNDNAQYGCDATLTATATAGTPVVIAAPQGGLNTNNYGTVTITIPNETGSDCTYSPLTGATCRSVGLQIVAMNNSANEHWNIDNVILCGTPVTTDVLSCVCAPSGDVCSGSDFDLTICALTTNGNIDASYDGTISLANATLSGTTTSTASCGCAIFTGLSSTSTSTETIMVSGTGGISAGSHMISFIDCTAPLPSCPASNVTVATAATGDCDYYEMTVTHDHPSPGTVAGTEYFIFIGGDAHGPFTYSASNPQSAGPFTSVDFVGDGTAAVEVAIGNLVVNEIHADPDATTGDANGDGVIDSGDDEFVEIVNYTCGNIDISGWEMTGASHTFAGSQGSGTTVLAPGQAIVIFGGGTPIGFAASGAIITTASGGFIGLTNSGETIEIFNACGISVSSTTYGAEASNNQSITRDDDVVGAFVQHNSSTNGSSYDYTPGYLQDATTVFGYAAACDGSCSFDEPSLSSPVLPNVIISEIQTDPGSGDANGGEWVELLCSSGTCDVSGFYLTNGEFLVVIPDGTILSAGEYYTIGSDIAANGAVTDPLNHDLSSNGGYSHDLNTNACASCNCIDGVWEVGEYCGGATVSDITLDNAAEQLALFSPCSLDDPVFAVAWGGGEGLPIAKDIPASCGGSSCPTAQQIQFPISSDGSFYDYNFNIPSNSTSAGNETGCTTSYAFNGSSYILDDTPTPGLTNIALAYDLTINGVTYAIGALERLEDEENAINAAIGSVLTICDGDEISVIFSQIDNQTLAPNMGMLITGVTATGPAMTGGYGSGISFGSASSATDLSAGLAQTVTAADDGMLLYIRIVELGYQTSVGGSGIGYLSGDCSAYENGELGMSSDCIFELEIEIDVIDDVEVAIDQSDCPDSPFTVNVLSGAGPFIITGTDDDASNTSVSINDNIAGLSPGSSYTITVTDNNGCTTTSAFTIDPDCTSAILPVDFSLFTAVAERNYVLLDWSTASEINNSHFEVQWSEDANNFKTIGEVSSQGNSNAISEYSFKHYNPEALNYYRLKQVDYDGQFEYSDIRQVKFDDINGVIIRPTVTNDKVIIEYSNAVKAKVVIYDLHGRMIISDQISSGDELDLSTYAQGTYIFRISIGDKVVVKKVIKS